MHPKKSNIAPIELSQLSENEKIALVQCSLFNGGFTQDAVECVLLSKEQEPYSWPLDTIETLRVKGFINTTESISNHHCYILSPLAREIATKQLPQTNPKLLLSAKKRLTAYYSRLGSQKRIDTLSQHGGERLLQLLELEQPNLERAIDFALSIRDYKSAAGIFLAYSSLVNLKGLPHNLSPYCSTIVPNLDNGILKLRVVIEYSQALRNLPNIRAAKNQANLAIKLAEQLGSSHHKAVSLRLLGIIAIQEGNTQLAIRLTNQALDIHRNTGNRIYEGITQGELGILYRAMGSPDTARICHEESLLIHREVGNIRGEGVAISNLALINTELGKSGIATELYEEAIDLLRITGHHRLEGCALGNLGDLYLDEGRVQEAQEYLETAVEIAKKVGHQVPEGAFLGSLAELHRQEGNLVQARSYINRAEVLIRKSNDAVELAKLICRKGLLDITAGNIKGAVSAHAESQQLLNQLGITEDNALATSITELSNLIDLQCE